MTRTTRFSIAALATSLLLASPAFAREGDVEACIDLAEGDDCTRADGDPGICQPDDSDPDVLECDDDALADDAAQGCSASGRPLGDASGLVLVGAALGLSRLRRRR
jgi:hypothetical protein